MSALSKGDTLVVELLTEELPPKALPRLGTAFADGIANELRSRGFLSEASTVERFATPRRLAVKISNVALMSPDVAQRDKLLPINVALDAEGKPTVAFRKALAKRGREALADRWSATTNAAENGAERLAKESDGKTDAIFLYSVAKGSSLATGLQAALDGTISSLPIPKVMTYQRPDGSEQKFVRPAHRLLALHGDAIVAANALGLASDRLSEGHRFQGTRALSFASADDYPRRLQSEGCVIANFDERRATIERALRSKAKSLSASLSGTPSASTSESARTSASSSASPLEDAYTALLDEVTALTENPAVYAGAFEAEFLDVPQECLILTMRTNQKYFPLFDEGGKLRRDFLIVSNMQLDDPSRVIQGNERVVRPRLADAKFFYDQDRKTKLADRVARLGSVVYHNKLGTQLQRVERMQKLATKIATAIGADAGLAQHAAALAKADLVTDMVGEFPELQGIMGRYYALHDREPAAVADAIEQHYRPKFAGDALPESPVAVAVALADKLDTLVGIYGIGLVPTGDKDAFGLRRHAVGVLRILIEKKLPVALTDLLAMAAERFPPGLLSATVVGDLHGFMLERLRGMLRDQGYSANEIEAVLSQMPTRIDVVPARLAAVREFGALPEAAALASANKRIQNILKKSDATTGDVDPALISEVAEKQLSAALLAAEPGVGADLAAGRYTPALKALAALRGDVDAFFDQVMVNADDPKLRANRHALLRRLGLLMNQVADISKLAA